MKLLFCEECHDVVALSNTRRECACGSSWGQYREDGLTADIGGDALCIGIDNYMLDHVMYNRWRHPEQNLTIAAWIIGDGVETVVRS